MGRWRRPPLPLALLLLLLPALAAAIKCYQCDALEQPSDCPGWHRPPIDTYKDKKDRGGLFTHCVEIKLANGTVLHQGPYPENPSCGAQFKQVWKLMLSNRFKQHVSVRCCDYNMCNGPSGGRAGGDRFPSLGLALGVAAIHATRMRWR